MALIKVKNRATGKISELTNEQFDKVNSDSSWHRVFERVADDTPDEVLALQEKQAKQKVSGKTQTGAKDNNTKPAPEVDPETIPA